MAEFVDSWPTARKRHYCGICYRSIQPGETYWRQAGFDGNAWTNKTCEHCERVEWAYLRSVMESEYDREDIIEWWLPDEYPAVYAQMLAGWRFPDGELVPLPFGSRCHDCGCRVEFRRLWCGPCDERRIARIYRGFSALLAALDEEQREDVK